MRRRRNEDGSPVVVFPRSWLVAGVLLVVVILIVATGSYGPRSSSRVHSSPMGSAQVRPVVVNVNVASFEELCTLPRVSGSIAQSSIAGRPYSSVDDLLRVNGIGPKTLQRMRPYVRTQ